MTSNLEDIEEFLRSRNEELEARAEASVAAADAVINKMGSRDAEEGTNIQLLVEENIQSVLRDMDELPEMGIRDSLNGGIVEEDSFPGQPVVEGSAASQPDCNPERADVRAQEAAGPSRRRTGSGGGRRQSDAEESSELDVPGHVPATVRLHKAKIRALEQELAGMKGTLQDKEKKLTSYQQQIKELQGEKAKFLKEKKNLELECAKAKRNYDNAKAEISQKDSTIKDLHHNMDRSAAKEKRGADTEQRSREVRLNRALEEVEKYKRLLEEVKANDRDGKQVAKADYNKVVAENKKLERQKQELLVAFKKQMKLIDVLRRQKLHMEAARQIAFTEEEFLRTLDIST